VVAEIFFGKFHGLAGFNGSSEMDHGVDGTIFENAVDGGTIRGIAGNERSSLRYGAFAPVGEIVEDDDFVAAVDELFGDDGADEAGAAGDEDALRHVGALSSGTNIRVLFVDSCLRRVATVSRPAKSIARLSIRECRASSRCGFGWAGGRWLATIS